MCIEGRIQFDSYVKEGKTIEQSEIIADNMQMLDRGLSAADMDVSQGQMATQS